MATTKLGLVLALAVTASMAGCGGASSEKESTDERAPSSALADDGARQSLERTWLARQGYKVVSHRATAPIVDYKSPADYRGEVIGYHDCFNVEIDVLGSS